MSDKLAKIGSRGRLFKLKTRPASARCSPLLSKRESASENVGALKSLSAFTRTWKNGMPRRRFAQRIQRLAKRRCRRLQPPASFPTVANTNALSGLDESRQAAAGRVTDSRCLLRWITRKTGSLETCHLKHVGGHTQSNSFAVRSSGRPTRTRKLICKAATTAKRNALCNAWKHRHPAGHLERGA